MTSHSPSRPGRHTAQRSTSDLPLVQQSQNTMMGQHWLAESLEIKSEGHAYGLLVPKYLAHVEIASGDMCYWLPTTGDVC